MDSGTEGSEPRSSSVRHPTDRPPCHQNSFTESGSDVAEKALEGKEETLLSPLRESRTQRRGPEPKTEEEDPRESEPKRDSCISGSESEGCSSWEGSGKRKVTSSDSTCPPAAGASPAGERSVTPGKRKRTTPDSGQGSESEETAGAQRRRRGARGAGRRSRCRSPGDRLPPLRKRLVTAVRALSEAVRQDVAGAWEQRERSPLTWEQRSGLGRLWAPLCAALQTVYTMANQAAYVFPAESWLVPAPPPGPRAPAGDTGEARGSPPRVGREAASAQAGTRAAAELRAQPPGRDQGPATAHTAGTARVRLGALGAKALPTPSAELTSSCPISC
ncbi:protein FRG2-like [Neofelis nebulosa]|uniref:protein FRG2-like n=1 Tax=Neofelis nebulosa TaxID=61452 RepID=UPI00272BDD1E|nr:protein FRG2-like [Neofelis nebulosa]XP_058563672.1 protein FRG2-like [Neofelis nebulosa]